MSLINKGEVLDGINENYVNLSLKKVELYL